MDAHSLYLYLPLFFFFFFSLYIFTKHVLNTIRNLPPSPFLTLPVLGHLYRLKKPLHRTLSQVSARYGPVLLRFGSRPVLLVSSPSAAEECLTRNDVVFANRPRLVAGKYLGYNWTSLEWAPYGDHWRNLRHIAATAMLSSNRLQLLVDLRANEVRLLIQRLLGVPTGGAVDMKVAFFELMLNVLMRMIAGKRYYGSEDAAEAEEGRRFQEIVKETFYLAGKSNMEDFLPFLRAVGVRRSEKTKRLMKVQEKRDGFMQGLIEEQRGKMGKCSGNCEGDYDCGENGGRKKTMIEVLLGLQEKEAEYYTDQTIRAIMLVVLPRRSVPY